MTSAAHRPRRQAAHEGGRTSSARTRPLLRDPLVAALVAVLAATRQAQQITQRDLAARIGVEESQVGAWECGHRQPRLINLLAWAQALGGVVVIAPAAAAEGGAKPAAPTLADLRPDFSQPPEAA